jgi:hypothetical protein
MLRLGDQSWKNRTALVVDGATLAVKGSEGAFDISCNTVKNSADDRCAIVHVTVKNGGVIETDRVFSTPPITHKLDDAEGLHITLDGGTYRLGSEFGVIKEETSNPRQHPNQLFGGARARNDNTNVDLDYTAEVEMTIGEKGGVFDLSAAQASTLTNTVAGRPVDVIGDIVKNFENGFYPTRGPRWIVNGPLTVKGNGDQSFVINGLDASVLDKIGADGAVTTVISDNDANISSLTLGKRGGWRVKTEDGEFKNLTVESVDVIAGGTYDAGAFNVAKTTFGNVTFGDKAILSVSRVNGTPLKVPVSGTVTLANNMYYRSKGTAEALMAVNGILPLNGKGVTWTPVAGSSDLLVTVTGDTIRFDGKNMTILIR